MGISFVEAFQQVSGLPQSRRLLVGEGPNLSSLNWSVQDVERLDLTQDPGQSTLQRELRTRIAQSLSGEGQTGIVLITEGRCWLTVTAIGVTSVESFERLLRECTERVTTRYGAHSPASRTAQWKRPLLCVFRLLQKK
jgi:hypothetical protein